MTTIAQPIPVKKNFRTEAVFLQQLEAIFQKDFNARITPGEDQGSIRKAVVNTEEKLELDTIRKLVNLAGTYRIQLKIGRSGAGLKIQFGKD